MCGGIRTISSQILSGLAHFGPHFDDEPHSWRFLARKYNTDGLTGRLELEKSWIAALWSRWAASIHRCTSTHRPARRSWNRVT
jgi:hypothetical protein